MGSRRGILVLVVALPLLMAVDPALASRAYVVGLPESSRSGPPRVVYEAGPGEANRLGVGSTEGVDVTFTENLGVTVTAGENCISPTVLLAICHRWIEPPRQDPVYEEDLPRLLVRDYFGAVLVDLGDRADTISTAGAPTVVVASGGPGDDQMRGGEYVDHFDGGPGSDLISGGAQVDLASYSDRPEPLRITMDDLANDGAAGEGDNVLTDVEWVGGGDGPDYIAGNAGDNGLFGSSGDDEMHGLEGSDYFISDLGEDRMFGGPGDDRFEVAYYSVGGDLDHVACGEGLDTVIADVADDVAADCEQVTRI